MSSRDTPEKIARDALVLLGRASEALDEADRLLAAEYGGTEKWCQEVEAWRRRKDKIIDCSR